MVEQLRLPHKLTLDRRGDLQMTGVTEVVTFDENTVILKTSLGIVTIHGQGLQLKNLSLEGGQVVVDGTLCAFVYEEPRGSGLRRLFR